MRDRQPVMRQGPRHEHNGHDHQRAEEPVERHEADQALGQERPLRVRNAELPGRDVVHDEAGDDEEHVDTIGEIERLGRSRNSAKRMQFMQRVREEHRKRGEKSQYLEAVKAVPGKLRHARSSATYRHRGGAGR